MWRQGFHTGCLDLALWEGRKRLWFRGMCVCVCVCVCMHACVCLCAHVCECVHVCTCVCVCAQSPSHVWLFATSWIIACQALLSMEFSRQEYQSGLPFSPPEDLPNPGIKPMSPVSPALAGGFFTTAPPGKPRPEADGFKIWASEFQSQLSQGTLGIHLLDPDRLGENGLIPGRLHILWVRTFKILSLKGLNQILLIPLHASQVSFAI